MDESITKQDAQALSEDPVFRVGELDAKLTRANAVFTRISSIPKPKEKKPVKKAKNFKKCASPSYWWLEEPGVLYQENSRKSPHLT